MPTLAQPGLRTRYLSLVRDGDYAAAYRIAKLLSRTTAHSLQGWYDMGYCALLMQQHREAIQAFKQVVIRHPGHIDAFNGLAQAYGQSGDAVNARISGLQSLKLADREFSKNVPRPRLQPKAFQAEDPSGNIIAFSLFGGLPKYCETAILNAKLQETVYPGWTCRFYVDGSVPVSVLRKLKHYGAQIVHVSGALKALPGPMWRLAALDDGAVDRVLFRDADSVISAREAAAVADWTRSKAHFHMMRDSWTHTELVLAGMWGSCGACFTNITEKMTHYIRQHDGESHHDQHFIRSVLWPVIRTSLLQHDSIFGFMQARPFPDGPRPDDNTHVGYAEGAASFQVTVDAPEDLEVVWILNEVTAAGRQPVCSYPGSVKQGRIVDQLPARYVTQILSGAMQVDVVKRRIY